MPASIINHVLTRRAVFYDELSNFNPIYASPTDEDLLPIEAERRYHLRNLRLLSLYFEDIFIMTGNLLNFTNHTTKAVVLNVVSDNFFSSLLQLGVITLCGWGTQITTDMIQNQVDYTKIFTPELKDRKTINRIRSVMSSADILVREESSGEVDFIDFFLDRMHLRSERSSHEDWKRVEECAQLVQSEFGYLGTLEFFPHLSSLDPVIRRQAHEVYLDAWIDYAAERYYPIRSYESPRLKINTLRTIMSSSDDSETLASILLSPQFFETFLLRFLRKEEYYRLLNLSPQQFVQLRNEDWSIFCDRYHTYLKGCSDVLWRMQILSETSTLAATKGLFEEVIHDTIYRLPGALDASLLTSLISHAVGFFSGIPGLGILIKSAFQPIIEILNRRASQMVSRIGLRDLYPFIIKIQSAVT